MKRLFLSVLLIGALTFVLWHYYAPVNPPLVRYPELKIGRFLFELKYLDPVVANERYPGFPIILQNSKGGYVVGVRPYCTISKDFGRPVPTANVYARETIMPGEYELDLERADTNARWLYLSCAPQDRSINAVEFNALITTKS